ncbi:MAG: hypothetical protein KYX66_10335 [Blastomonas fulva]|uniref:hypothetical protein n=1 Tax=Blastomonas fulva TaxID=1550728 RepID=UPI0024E19D9B|nr:hypothetical protein [Blastomonas fulva]MDK2757123.1 hypothetical protein [Blastomonas fulva]
MIGIAILVPALLATQAAVPVAVPAPPETVAEFLAQADALLAAGNDAAATSPQADTIRSALQQAAMAYRASLTEAVQRGAPPASCPPPPGQAQLSLGDITELFRAFPDANRPMPVTTAFALVMTLRFPCPTPP